jgi:multiple antibiotic resistance protein
LILLVLKSFALALSALLPVINPLGSALIFLGLVGDAPAATFLHLARKIAFSTIVFLLIIEVGGAALLAFFGISLPVVQFAGGLVVAAMGWRLLNNNDTEADQDKDKDVDSSSAKSSATSTRHRGSLEEQIFYPLTFPITAGPGCIVVTVTLSAHAARQAALGNALSHLGIALAIVVCGITVFLSYAYAPKITRKIAPQTIHGILRVIAFVLLCIGVQISWRGLEAMIKAISN